jgi:hypothetical protein
MNDKAKELGLEFKIVEGIPSWAEFQPEVAVKDGVEYHRKKGSDTIYKQNTATDGFECLDCGTVIRIINVVHPVQDGFSKSISDKYKPQTEPVPFCPFCESKPKYLGEIIKVNQIIRHDNV